MSRRTARIIVALIVAAYVTFMIASGIWDEYLLAVVAGTVGGLIFVFIIRVVAIAFGKDPRR